MQVMTCLCWATDVFKALAEPTRRTILDELTDRDEQTLYELCSRLLMNTASLERQAISNTSTYLRAPSCHLIRDGKFQFHYLDTSPLKAIADRWPTRF